MNPQEPNAVPETGRAVTKYTAEHGREVGLPSPEAVNYMMSVAKLITSTALITRDMGLSADQIGQLRQMGFKPEEIEQRQMQTVQANAFAKMLVAREFPNPIPPFAAQQELTIVKGKIFTHYATLMAQMQFKGIKLKVVERSNDRAAIDVTMPGEDAPTLYEYTIEDAKMAGLIRRSKDGDALQYELRPRVMLWARLISEVYRATGGRANVFSNEERREVLNDEEADHHGPEFQHPEESPFKVTPKSKENGTADGGVTTHSAPANEGTKQEVKDSPDATRGSVDAQAGKGVAPSSVPLDDVQGRQSKGTAQAESPQSGTKVQTGHTQPAEDTKPKRGRVKQDMPPPVSNTAPPTSEGPSPKDSGGYQASDDDVPGNIGTPKPAPPTERPIMDRINAVCDGVATISKMDPGKAKAYAQLFMREFLHLEKLPRPIDNPEKYAVVLPIMESLLERKRNIASAEMGAEAGTGWDQLVRHIDTWPEATKAVAKEVAIRHYPEHPSDVLEFIESNNVEEADLFGFLWIALRSPALAAKAKDGQVSIAVLVSGLNPDATEQDILSAIAKGSAEDQPELWQ